MILQSGICSKNANTNNYKIYKLRLFMYCQKCSENGICSEWPKSHAVQIFNFIKLANRCSDAFFVLPGQVKKSFMHQKNRELLQLQLVWGVCEEFSPGSLLKMLKRVDWMMSVSSFQISSLLIQLSAHGRAPLFYDQFTLFHDLRALYVPRAHRKPNLKMLEYEIRISAVFGSQKQ